MVFTMAAKIAMKHEAIKQAASNNANRTLIETRFEEWSVENDRVTIQYRYDSLDDGAVISH